MARYAYERLSAQDASFLFAEGPNTPMHVSAIQIYEAGPLREDGGIAIDKVRAAYESVIHLVPRYRQKLAWIPVENRPVWVDDPYFQIDYHIRHVALPHPGTLEALKRVASRLIAHPLDRNRPLWELWVVEGLQGDRFATVSKVHHCMVDGASGVELAQRLLSPDPHHAVETPPPYYPRPIPSGRELLQDELMRRALMPIRALRSLQSFRAEVEDVREEVGVRLKALADLVGIALTGVSDTPMNGPLSPHRRFDWLDMSLAEVKAVRKALGCTVNDVVLGLVTEAVRRFMISRNVDPAHIRFRAATPVNVRSDQERTEMGNRVSSWMVELPIGEPDRLKQIEILKEATQQLKSSRQALGVDMIMAAADVAPIGLMGLGAQMVSGPVNTIVTNVPGPQFPLYMLGAKMLAMIPEVPLLEGLGLGIALMSYNGRVFWGFTGDYEMMPDLSRFVRSIEKAFAELAGIAGVQLGSPDDRPPQEAARSLPEGARPVLTAVAGESRTRIGVA